MVTAEPTAVGAGRGWFANRAEAFVPHGAGTDLRLGYDLGDLENLDLDRILGPLLPGGIQPDTKINRPHDAVTAQRKAMQAPVERSATNYSAQHSLIHGPALAGGRCGERMEFTVTVLGEDGKPFGGGIARVSAAVSGSNLLSKAFPEPRAWVEDRKDGTHVARFVCATPGPYDIVATVDGVPLPMCPIGIEVQPGVPSAAHCDLHGEGTHSCVLGGHAEFSIQACDEYGNKCSTGGHRFGVRAVGHAKLHEVADNEDGTYSICYSVPQWASGPVRLEVLLDGLPVKGSPLTPVIVSDGKLAEPVALAEPTVPAPGLKSKCVVGAAEQLQYLSWLRDNPPAEVPQLPPMPDGRHWGPVEVPAAGDTPMAHLAWRAADEWQRLVSARGEMEKCRERLVEHQEVLIAMGDAVQSQLKKMQTSAIGLEAERTALGAVEARIENMRAGLSREYKEQQRICEARQAMTQQQAPAEPFAEPLAEPVTIEGGACIHREPIATGTILSRNGSPRCQGDSPSICNNHPWRKDAANSEPSSLPANQANWSVLDTVGSTSSWQNLDHLSSLENREMEQLRMLHKSIEEKKQRLAELEDVGRRERAGYCMGASSTSQRHLVGAPKRTTPLSASRDDSSVPPPPTPPPRMPPTRAEPPPRKVPNSIPPPSQNLLGVAEVLPPPIPPPALNDLVLSEPLADLSQPCGTPRLPTLLSAPPPPPTPPPPIPGRYGGQRTEPISGVPNTAEPMAGVSKFAEPMASRWGGQRAEPVSGTPRSDGPIAGASSFAEPIPGGWGSQHLGLGSSTPHGTEPVAGASNFAEPIPGRCGGHRTEPIASVNKLAEPSTGVGSCTEPFAGAIGLGTSAGSGGASLGELGLAMQQVFYAFATRSLGSVRVPSGPRSGRAALGLQDFLRLARAARLRMSHEALEEAFCATTQRFGKGGGPYPGEPALAYELFVELLVETARRRYQGASDEERTAIFFEEHLLPLAKRLRALEMENQDSGAGVGGTGGTGE